MSIREKYSRSAQKLKSARTQSPTGKEMKTVRAKLMKKKHEYLTEAKNEERRPITIPYRTTTDRAIQIVSSVIDDHGYIINQCPGRHRKKYDVRF